MLMSGFTGMSQRMRTCMSKVKKAILITLGSLCGISLIGAAIWYFIIWPVTPVDTKRYLELGDSLSAQVEDYLEGYGLSLRFATVDISGVDQDTLGEYKVYVTHGSDVYEYHVIVRDTIAPEITKKEGRIYVATDSFVKPEMLVGGVQDVSGEVMLKLENNGEIKKHISYYEIGAYELTVVAVDSSGNITKQAVSFTVDTAPVLSGMQDIYVTAGLGSDAMFKDVQALDDVDGNLTAQIQLEKSPDWEHEGIYDVVLYAVDKFGLKGEATVTVHILAQNELDALLAHREINRKEDMIKGASNPYTAGVGEVELESQKEYMLPVVVRISDMNAVRTSGWYGSGFIIDIDEEYVYVASNKHVLRDVKETTDVYFFDGTSAGIEIVGLHEEKDIGIAKVSVEDIAPETLEQLMCVHISKERNAEIEAGEEAFLFMEVIGENGLQYTRDGKSTGVVPTPHYVDYPTLRYTIKSVHGNSGSAVFDEDGYLVAMAAAAGRDKGDTRTYTYGMLASDVLEYYEAVTGNYLYSE